MQIHNLQSNDDSVYHEADFQLMLEAHLTYLRQTNIRLETVSEHQTYKYEGDFYGLLDDINVIKKFHYVTLRVNGYEHSGDYKGDRKVIVIPDFNLIEQLRSVYQTKNSF